MARTKRKVNPVLPATPPAEEKQRIYRAKGYARLSVEDSGKPGADTIEDQKELLQDFIERQPDMEYCGLLCDNGQTGTNFDRPAFEQLLEEVRAGKIDCIVVKDLSRFGRNYKETGNYLERVFPFLDVRFVAINDHFDTLTAERSSDGYIVPLKNIINEVYSRDISRKTASALTTKRKNGEFIGTWAAYGYRKCAGDPHRIEPDEETAPVVRDIFRWRLSGMGYAQILRRLTGAGIPSPSKYHYLKGHTKCERYANAVWQIPIIKKILSNEIYLGHMVQGRKRSALCEGGGQVRVEKNAWIIVRNTHEALIDEETFRAVQKITEGRRQTYFDRLGRHDCLRTSPNILKGLIYCSDCKRPLVRYKSVTGNGQKLAYIFICPSHSEDPACCPKKYLHEAELKEVLWRELQTQIVLAGDLEVLLDRFQRSEGFLRQEEIQCREITAARKKLERTKMLYDSLYQNYVDRLINEQEYIRMKQEYRADIEQAQKSLEKYETRRKECKQQSVGNPWLAAYSRFRQETELTAGMAHALIERVVVDAGNHISITLRYRDEYLALVKLLEAQRKAVGA